MAQGDSIVGICNAALIALGEPPIVALTDPVKAAILCSAKYDQVRREVLASSPWNCAMKSASIAASTAAPPISQYANAFPLPADCLRVFDVPDVDMASWDIQNPFGTGRCLMTDLDAPLDLLYVFDLQDPTQFEPELAKAIARALAVDIAKPLTGSDTAKKDASAEAEAALETARLTGSQENSPKEWDEDIWLRSRQ